jgi:hypothetical protein
VQGRRRPYSSRIARRMVAMEAAGMNTSGILTGKSMS